MSRSKDTIRLLGREKLQRFLACDLFGMKLAEKGVLTEGANIYWQKRFRNRFELIASMLESDEDISLAAITKPYRLLMSQLNGPELLLEESYTIA